MKLSEAIRKGAKKTEALIGMLYSIKSDRVVATCAIGSAYIGCGKFTEDGSYWDYTILAREFPILKIVISDLPEELQLKQHHTEHILTKHSTIGVAIVRLNDQKIYSREAIAMWIEQIENHLDKQNHMDLDVKNFKKGIASEPVKLTQIE